MTRPAALPPFRTLDPALAVAERLLGTANRELIEVVAALPDEHAATARLNAVLAATGARPRLTARPDGWGVVLVGPAGEVGELVDAAKGIAELVACAGWRRLKRCAVCATPFVDRTNGCSRRWCADHRRKS
jgi:predicted RNA-binding Zn ribbon-like protein